MSPAIHVEITNRQSSYSVPQSSFYDAARTVLTGEGFHRGEIGIAVVDNREIHAFNQRFLQHDYPTDVITFPMDATDEFLSGEIMLSAEYAADEARLHGWKVEEEMTLYVVHGCLHLAGYDDHEEQDQQAMRERERHYLKQIGIVYAGLGESSPSKPSAADSSRASHPGAS